MVIKSAMIIEEEYGNYYTISLDAYDEKPYTKTPAFKIVTEDNKSIFESKEKMFFKGDIIDIKPSEDGKVIWTKKQDYKEHNYEYAVVLYRKPDDLRTKLNVYGNKIQTKDAYIIGFDSNFKSGQKVLLEKQGKSYFVVHNITMAKLIYDMQQNGPQIR